jgi:cell division protein FtsL
MHNRQSGAAHVPIMFFLILLVMFLGAVAFAYATHAKNGELIEQRDKARLEAQTLKNKDLLIEHYVDDIGRVIGKPGKYEGRQAGIYGDATLTYGGLMNPAELKKAMDDACAAAGVSIASSLETVLGSLVTKVSQANQRVKDIESERDKALADKSEVDRKFQEASATAQKTAREWNQALEQARSDYTAGNQERENRITQVTESLRAKADELTTEKEKAAAKEKALNNDIAKQKMQNSALVARDAMRKAPDVADGKVLVARNGIPTAFINLGRKDMLQAGTVFRVKTPNSDKVKGYATVTRVEEERAEVSLANFVDPVGDYAREGDLLFNDLFTPRVTRTIYLLGRFTAPYNKPELAALLKRLGNKVVDKMGPGVDTVILGNDPVNEAADGFDSVQNSDDFKLASELRVEFAYLATIRDLIKL